MTGRLADRVVVVTGAGGISSAGATRFAAEGAAVFVVSRDAEESRTLAGEVAAAGGAADWVPADLRDEAATVAAMERCRARFGRIDGLFAVAGGSGRRFGDGPLHDIPLGGWEETFAANATPMFVSAREAVRAMLERGEGGSLVIVTSVLADHPAPKFFATHAYAAAKGAARSFVRAVAAMYATSGIRVNAVAPGLIATPMSARAARDPATAAYARARQPLAGDLLPPEAIADAALFLLSDEARYITGQVLTVDGGWSVTDAAAGVDGGENV
ncbi:MAG TPA: SDR family oxidoreductase [Actinomycetota bacterium]|nr:SDR family oxidoreductase [Actinomycetota bacterium]